MGDREITRSKVEPFSAEVQGRFGGRTQPLLSRRILSRASGVQEAKRWRLLFFRQEVWNWSMKQRGAIEGRSGMMKEVF